MPLPRSPVLLTARFLILLQDDMGLGKTFQSITLIWTLLKQGLPASIEGSGAIAARVADVTETERLRTALAWFADFLADTDRKPFQDPGSAGGMRYNQDTSGRNSGRNSEACYYCYFARFASQILE